MTYITTVGLPVCGLLHCDLNKHIGQRDGMRLAAYVTVTLLTVDKPSNGRRTAVELISNGSQHVVVTTS